MKKRSYLFLAALATGLFFQHTAARAAYDELDTDYVAELDGVPAEEIPAEDAEDGQDPERVCFCHNVNHNPHTICTSDEALIHAHMDHVEGEGPGVVDTLGECEPEETPPDGEEPGDESETPGEETEEPTDETEEPSDETGEPGEAGETPEEVPAEDPAEEIPADRSEGEIPESTKVDGFDADGEIAVDEAVPGGVPAWYFEGSGNMGCSLGGAAGGATDLAPWVLLAAGLMVSPLRRIRK